MYLFTYIYIFFFSFSSSFIYIYLFPFQVSNNHMLSRWGKAAYVVVFTSTIPLGIATGVGLQSAPSANREIVSAVLEAFATGTIHNTIPFLIYARLIDIQKLSVYSGYVYSIK